MKAENMLYYYMYTYIHPHLYIYIYIYREREGGRQGGREGGRDTHTQRERQRETGYLSFKPLKHQLIKGPNKQKTHLLFLCFDIFSLSAILSFHNEFTIPENFFYKSLIFNYIAIFLETF